MIGKIWLREKLAPVRTVKNAEVDVNKSNPRIKSRDFARQYPWPVLALILIALSPAVSLGQEILPPGRYRLEMIMASISHLPFFGSSKSASKSVSLVDIKRDGSGLLQSHRVCDFRVLEQSAMIKLTFPEKFIAALANHSYPIQLEREARGWRYTADLGIERIGYREMPDESTIPSKIDDPAVFDWDGDGHPGATLKLSVPLFPEGELYVVQRGHSVLNGWISEPGRIAGSIDVRSFEQRVIGARPQFLNRSPNIEANPKDSTFVLTPVAPESTCETLTASIPTDKTAIPNRR